VGPTAASDVDDPSPPGSKREEAAAFIVLAVLIWPVIAVGLVGGLGFAIWMWQLVFGPPGPPA
jgi:nitrate reductase NapE